MTRRTEPNAESFLPLTSVVFEILVTLASGDRHGYSILTEIRDRSREPLRVGSLYRAIGRLLEDRLIEELDERPDPEADDERRRYYRLTRFGRDVAIAEVRRLEGIVSQAHAKKLLRVPAKGSVR